MCVRGPNVDIGDKDCWSGFACQCRLLARPF